MRVAASNRSHQCSPPAAHSARIGRRAAVASGVLPIVVRGGDVGAGSNEQLNHVLVAGACRLDERSLPAALWLRSDGSRCLARTRRLSMVASGTRPRAHGIPVFVLRVKVGAGGDEKLDHTRVE